LEPVVWRVCGAEELVRGDLGGKNRWHREEVYEVKEGPEVKDRRRGPAGRGEGGSKTQWAHRQECLCHKQAM